MRWSRHNLHFGYTINRKHTMNIKLKAWFKRKYESICHRLERSILSNKTLKCKVVFGPVHSRRLGTILGINNVKPGICSYNCIYCPGRKTSCCAICTNSCLSSYELYISVKNKLDEIKKANKNIEFILFAGSGDPCMDSALSKHILLLREFGYRIAVFTNSALLWNKKIRENLMFADYVSIKTDTVNENTWLKMNRPHERLKYDHILNGIRRFADNFKGDLATETTLVKGFNDNPDEIRELSKFINTFRHDFAYFMTPVYPPSENYAVGPEAETLNTLSEIIKGNISNALLLWGHEKEDFFITNDFENELLGLLALHPVSENAVRRFAEANNKKDEFHEMITSSVIKLVEYNGNKYLSMDMNN